MILLTLSAFTYDFPQYWNKGVESVHLPSGFKLPESTYRLGLDLQGGAHLVYDANMSQISESERAEALEGVKNVIEKRVNAFGVAEPLVQTISTGGTHRLIIELAGIKDVTDAINQIGETPVLEFKEPSVEVERELTDEEKVQLKEKQQSDRASANAVLKRALAGESFDTLITEKSLIKLEQSTIKAITDDSPYGDFKKAIDQKKVAVGSVHPTVQENPQGLNILRVEEKADVKELLLSHILICFEGSNGCQNPISEIEASTKINSLKKEATAENFAELAKSNSVDASASNGGDLGWATALAYVPTFATAAQDLSIGSVSNIVKTDFGYHLIYKRDERSIPAYTIKRILMPLTTEMDIVPPVSPWKNTALSGKDLKRASVQFDPNTGVPSILIEFSPDGDKLFGDLTATHVGQKIAIFLDGNLLSDPVITEPIYGGQATIKGDFRTSPEQSPVDGAKELVRSLNAGALPVPIELVSQQTVGPTLGIVSLQKSVVAALVGYLFVALFMIVFYRLPGVIASVALLLFAGLNLAAYRFFDVTITLAGIAGFVLSMGIAVDANVLIFARMKEEFAAGRDFNSAIDEGFTRAWSAIRDGHLTTLIASLVLYWFSSSFIRGFALTLSVGVILSLFTAITVTRIYLKNVTAWKWARHPVLFAIKKS